MCHILYPSFNSNVGDLKLSYTKQMIENGWYFIKMALINQKTLMSANWLPKSTKVFLLCR